jgi:hypothetical protein
VRASQQFRQRQQQRRLPCAARLTTSCRIARQRPEKTTRLAAFAAAFSTLLAALAAAYVAALAVVECVMVVPRGAQRSRPSLERGLRARHYRGTPVGLHRRWSSATRRVASVVGQQRGLSKERPQLRCDGQPPCRQPLAVRRRVRRCHVQRQPQEQQRRAA